jgi:hypothetical protein
MPATGRGFIVVFPTCMPGYGAPIAPRTPDLHHLAWLA